MVYCPGCKQEYKEDVKNCPECGAELDRDLVESKENAQGSQGEYIKLINVANGMEADLMISQLEEKSIPAYKGYQASGSFLNIVAGFNYQGTDIFVPKVFLKEAEEIAAAEKFIEFEEADDGEEKEFEVLEKEFEVLENEFRDKRRSRLSLIIFIVVVMPTLFILLDKFRG